MLSTNSSPNNFSTGKTLTSKPFNDHEAMIIAKNFFRYYSMCEDKDLLLELLRFAFAGSKDILTPEERGELIVFYGDARAFLSSMERLNKERQREQEIKLNKENNDI
nr:hypothetical protein [Pedobacter panaciterrae]